MKVIIAASEAEPFAKTGGLGDVIGALHKNLLSHGTYSTLIMPLYRTIKERFSLKDTGILIRVPIGAKSYISRIYSAEGAESVFFVQCDSFFDRDELYGTSQSAYEDNDERFIFFSRAVLEAVKALGIKPDIIHSNDWQTGLVPAYMKSIYKGVFGSTASLFTIHNLGYQGIFPKTAFECSGLPSEFFGINGVEFFGQMNFLKAGIIYADAITTVSPNYAKEILTPEYGFGLDGVLRARQNDLIGILNGIDTDSYNPQKDKIIPANYSAKDISGKIRCKQVLLKECRLSGSLSGPVMSMIGRLTAQKGIDIFLNAAHGLLADGACLLVLGKGEEQFETALRALAKKYPKRFFLRIGFDDGLARRMFAGSDIVIIPSKYEPCGLTQMIAMTYGTIAVARNTGGLADTIEDCTPVSGKGTGFLFMDASADALLNAAGRALCAFRDSDRWSRTIKAAMKKDFSWKSSVKKYLSLYRSLIKRTKAV